jgi:elongation factor P--(R)-beta-lysine ligase
MATLKNLHLRATIVKAMRAFFYDHDYLEVDTPCRIPAPMPEAAIVPQPAGDWFLQTSPEICMKRLLAAGLPRIFQISHTFRKDERGCRHLPEFTLAEWYARDRSYLDLMAETEALLRRIAEAANCPATVCYRQHTIDLAPNWPRMTVAEAFDRFAPASLNTSLAEGRFDDIMGVDVEPRLGWDRPVFIYDYPAPQGAAFARLKPGHAQIAERFELYLGGVELCNGFSELTGADAYRFRFDQEQKASVRPRPIPEAFLHDMEEMPPAAGNALGVDRLVMLFCDAARIDEVVAFTPEAL